MNETRVHTIRTGRPALIEDFRAGRLLGLGAFFPEQARDTSERIHQLTAEAPTVLVPSHDAEAPQRLATAQRSTPE